MTTNLILIAALFNSSIIMYGLLKANVTKGKYSLMTFASSSVIGAFANWLIYSAHFPQRNELSILLYGTVFISFGAFFIFCMAFEELPTWFGIARFWILAILPLASLVVAITILGGSLFATDAIPGGSRLLAPDNPAGWVNSIYINMALLLNLVLVSRARKNGRFIQFFQAEAIMIGISGALLLNNSFSASSVAPFHELKLIAILLLGMGLNIGLHFPILPEPEPVLTREQVFQRMSDGIIVLDNTNIIIDINSSAQKIIGVTGEILTGQPAEKIFIHWPNLAGSLGETRELTLNGSVQIDDDWRYLNIHVSPLHSETGRQLGKIITWRDITERKVADAARQQARDDMFILLHSITSAASRALNLDDFLSESIYQIVYTSHSQSIAVYITEEHARKDKPKRLVLAAHHGLPVSLGDRVDQISMEDEIVKWVLDHNEPILISNIQDDARLPDSIRELGESSLLVIPMLFEGQPLGLIVLTRTGLAAYSADEIARLNAVSDEVATFIQSNRQRQLSISLAERQRLVRDLHDSVTQRLYALVMLSEATRAGMQAGVTNMPEKVIDRMADNARQALKEMRLFLFQMQPVDFEREGLVAALRQRLSAVEGRADINARLEADENINLPLEKELATYFIVQEALNNVLKHAKAREVSISLSQKKNYFNIVVEDNGVGFNPKLMDQTGLGLKSMRERAEQIGGKLKIHSAPGTGTRISVAFKHLNPG
jgi:PAS domain S-box-containing protein